MTKILNLDDIEQSVDKRVTLNGEDHDFHPFTVDEFIAQLKEIEAVEKAGEMTVVDYTEFAIKSILRGFPTIQEADLRKLSVTKLKALTDFIKAEADEAEAEGVEAHAAEGNV